MMRQPHQTSLSAPLPPCLPSQFHTCCRLLLRFQKRTRTSAIRSDPASERASEGREEQKSGIVLKRIFGIRSRSARSTGSHPSILLHGRAWGRTRTDEREHFSAFVLNARSYTKVTRRPVRRRCPLCHTLWSRFWPHDETARCENKTPLKRGLFGGNRKRKVHPMQGVTISVILLALRMGRDEARLQTNRTLPAWRFRFRVVSAVRRTKRRVNAASGGSGQSSFALHGL